MADPIPQGTMIVPPRDPWDGAFSSYHQSLVDLDGDGVPDVAVPITGQGRRQVQRRAMAGLEPTPQQAAGLAADMPRLERNSETMADIGAFGASMLLPMGPVAKAVQYAPRTAGVLASTLPGFAALNSDEAEAQKATGKGGAPITPQRDEQGILNAIGDNAALKALYDQIRQAESRASGQVPGVNRESSDRIRGEAASQAAELRKQLNAELLKIQQSKAPFRDTAVGQMWPYVQAGAPILAGLAVKGGQNLLANRGPKALDNALLEFEKLRARGGTPGDLSYAAGKVGSIADDIKPPPQTMGGRAWETVRDTGPATIAGGTVGAELNLLPYQYDRRNAPVGSPAHTEAEQQLSAENWGRNALLGLGIGALGGQTASHLGQFGKRRAALGEAENIRRYESIPAVGQMSGDEVAAIAAQAEAVAQAQMLAGRQQALQGIRNAAPPNVGFTDLEMLTSSLIPRARVGEVPVPGGPGPGGPGPGGPSGRGLPSGGGGGPGPLPSGPSGGLPDIPPAPPPPGPPHPTPRNPPDPGPRSPSYGAEHSAISRQYLDELLASGQPIPSAKEIKNALAQRYGDTPSLSRPPVGDFSRRVDKTLPFVELANTLPPEAQNKMLNLIIGQRGFLALPAAAASAEPLNRLMSLYTGQEPVY